MKNIFFGIGLLGACMLFLFFPGGANAPTAARQLNSSQSYASSAGLLQKIRQGDPCVELFNRILIRASWRHDWTPPLDECKYQIVGDEAFVEISLSIDPNDGPVSVVRSCNDDTVPPCTETSLHGYPAVTAISNGTGSISWTIPRGGFQYGFSIFVGKGYDPMVLAEEILSAAEIELPSSDQILQEPPTGPVQSNSDCAGVTPEDLRAGGVAVLACRLHCDPNSMSDDELQACINQYSGQSDSVPPAIPIDPGDEPPVIPIDPSDEPPVIPVDPGSEPPLVPDNPDTYIPPVDSPPGTNPFSVAWDSLPAGLIRNPLIPIVGGLTGTALAWLYSQMGRRPIPGSLQPKDVPPIDNANAQGLYWSERPWDIAGPGYVSKEEYERTKGFVERGYKWTNGGWQTPEGIQHFDQLEQNNRAAVAHEDATWRTEWERKRQEGLAKRDAELKRILIDKKKEDLIDLERESDWNQRDSLQDDRLREVFTCRKDDGSISWKAMGVRVTTSILTLGKSELLYMPMDGLFRSSDRMISGQSATEAILKTGAEMGVEYVTGREIAKAGVWAVKTTCSKVLNVVGKNIAGSAEGIARELPEHLVGKKLAVQELMTLRDGLLKGTISQTEYEKAIARLYQNGGVKDLSALERMGHLSAEEAKTINQGLRTQINEVLDSGTKQTIQEVQESTGVKIKEVMLGDSGSSARQVRITSANTDADRALIVLFEKSDAEKYASQFHNGNIAKAEQELTTIFKNKQEVITDKLFQAKEFTLGNKDANLQVFDGFGKPGPENSYPAGHVQTSQATSGETTVFRVDPQGKVTSYNTSGQAMVDQHALMTHAGSATPLEAAPRISPADARKLAQQQIIAVSKPDLDAEKAAKAVLRAAKAASLDRPEAPLLETAEDYLLRITKAAATKQIDPALLKTAKDWRLAAQQMYQQNGEQAQNQFIKAVRKAILKQ